MTEVKSRRISERASRLAAGQNIKSGCRGGAMCTNVAADSLS